ncbi:hypothetical protein ACWDQO_25610 [Streptomyces sp. NPDC003703]|uniref:hypothetical protein n=1 Tax=Streptomyces sp. NPDC003283 TaxID=3364681 RepID=UPI00368D6667
MGRAVRRVGAEWARVYGAVRGPLLGRGPRAVPMTLAAVCLTALLYFAQHRPWGDALVRRTGVVRADDPLWRALLHTPLSLCVPAPDLPVWGALAQVLCVFGVAEICLGRPRTLAVAYAATLTGTLYARLGLALGPHHPLGLPPADAHVVDTGPSAAVVGLAVYVGLRHGAYLTAGAVTAAMAAEAALKDNLAGKEHLAAIAGAALLYAAPAALRRTPRRPPPPPPTTAAAAAAACGTACRAGAETEAGPGTGPGGVAGRGPGGRVGRGGRGGGSGRAGGACAGTEPGSAAAAAGPEPGTASGRGAAVWVRAGTGARNTAGAGGSPTPGAGPASGRVHDT